MSFELQIRPAPERLAAALGGSVIELRELTYRQMRDAMREGGVQDRASEGLLGASMHVDGKPVGLDAVLDLPGRFAGDIAKALVAVHEMHGLRDAAPAEDDEVPKH